MEPTSDLNDAKKTASEMAAELQALPVHNTSSERAVCRKYSHKIRQASPEFVIGLAQELLDKHGLRWQAYELIEGHQAAFRRIGKAELETFGRGNVPRTFAVCSFLADDHDDMAAKALSWALRELVSHDPVAVIKFLSENEHVLAARVKREVRNKLETGLKNLK